MYAQNIFFTGVELIYSFSDAVLASLCHLATQENNSCLYCSLSNSRLHTYVHCCNIWPKRLKGGFSDSFYVAAKTTFGVEAGKSFIRIVTSKSNPKRIASYPDVFGKGCVIQYISPIFWIAYALLLVHETCAWLTSLSYIEATDIDTALLVLILINALMQTRPGSDQIVSRGLRLIINDGK